MQFFGFFFQAEDGIRDTSVTGVQTCALPIFGPGVSPHARRARGPRRRHAGPARPGDRDALRGDGRRALPLRGPTGVSGAALIHVLVSGLATGSIYALMALSLVIIYNATRTLNFAQGEMLMVSTFAGWAAQRAFGLPLGVTLLVAVLAGAILAFLVERLVIRRAIGATHWDVLIITVGLSLVLRAGAGLTWTHDEFPFPSFFPNRPIALGPVRLAPV